MPITLTTVVGTAVIPDGTWPRLGRLEFVLTGWAKDDDTIYLPGQVDAAFSENGAFEISLQTSDDLPVNYDVMAVYWVPTTGRESRHRLGRISVPVSEEPVLLADLLSVPAPDPTVPDALAQALAAAAAAAGSAAATAADRVQTGLDRVQTAEDREAAELAAASINLRAVDDRAALAGLSSAQYEAAAVLDGLAFAPFVWDPSDRSTEIAAADPRYVAPTSDPTGASGAWFWAPPPTYPADYWQVKAYEDGAVNFEVEALNGAVNRWSAMGGTPTSGGGSYPPTLKVVGPGADISGSLVAKGEGGHIFGNALGKMLEVLAGVAGYITDRWITIRPGRTGQSYASIDAQAGLDLQAGGDTVVRILDAAGAGTAHLEISPGGTDFVKVATPLGKSLVLVGAENSGIAGLQLQHVTLLGYQWVASTVASGATVNLLPYRGVHLINPNANPIAALTIKFPASPVDGQTIRISPRATVTAVTWASLGGHTIVGAPAGLAANAPLSFIFFAGYGWQRI